MHIPLKLALFGRESGARLGAEQLVELRRPEERIAFADLAEPPVLSINRDFSAPVVVEARRSEEHTSELQSLMRISYAVFCLKKKKYYNSINQSHIQQLAT